jgi:hypothetical protein
VLGFALEFRVGNEVVSVVSAASVASVRGVIKQNCRRQVSDLFRLIEHNTSHQVMEHKDNVDYCFKVCHICAGTTGCIRKV